MKGKIILAVGFATFFAFSCGNGPTPPAPRGAVAVAGNQQEVAASTAEPVIVNVYVENSGSMDGYVKGVTEFEQAVYSYLSDVKLLDFCSGMNLNYINSQILKQPDDVRDFIEKLEPATFRQKGGNRGTTDISNIIGTIIKEQAPNEVNILVSDFVFSPGRNRDANQYVINQQIGIKGHLVEKLKQQPDFSAVMFQLNSNFNGQYYNCLDEPTAINAERPFYILLFGSEQNLHRLAAEVPKAQIKGSGVKNTYCVSNTTVAPDYGILTMPRIGSFVMDPANPKTGIKKAKIDNRDPRTKFSVSVGVDFSSLLLEDDYICDPNNYTVSNKAYTLSVAKNKTAANAYSHILTLSLNQNIISKGNVTVTLNKDKSTWAADMTDEDGVDINAPGAMEKTFGLKYLMDGIYDAYSAKSKNYASITINIQ